MPILPAGHALSYRCRIPANAKAAFDDGSISDTLEPQVNENLNKLQEAVKAIHRCDCTHSDTNRVVEFHGDRVFVGDVETFTLRGHPEASEAFAWLAGGGMEPRCVVVLKLPPVRTPEDAVRAAINSGQHE